MSLSIKQARASDLKAWDEFVEQHPEGRFCHLWGYRGVLEKTYGYRCIYLDILSGGDRVGIFPCIVLRRGLGRLISQPFNEYGGLLSKPLSADQYREIAILLLEVAKKEGCRGIEIRGGIGLEHAEQTGYWIRFPLYFYGVLRLDEHERLWRSALTNEARKGVKRAKSSGLTVEIRRGPCALEHPFYHLYLVSMKRLGVPPHPARFFEEFVAAFGTRLVAAWVKLSGETVAILLGIVSGQRMQIYITASDPRRWHLRPNDLSHWELIQWAAGEGLCLFDFGSARYPGQIQFKKKWGATLHEYSYYLIGTPSSVESRIRTVDSSSRPMVAMANLWRRLVPLRLTPTLGSPIRKFLTK